MVKELGHLTWMTGPTDKCVKHVAKLAERLCAASSKGISLKCFTKLAMTGNRGELTAKPFVCSYNFPLNSKKDGIGYADESEDVFITIPAQEAQGPSNGHHGE